MRRIAIINQKGGVGKTTTTANLGAALARAGSRVLLIDLDPQGHLSLHFGADLGDDQISVYDVLTSGTPIRDATLTIAERLALVPADIDLAGAEAELVSVTGREVLLREAVDAVAPEHDFVLIDCPPSLGVLTVNALVASSEVLIPLQAQFFALQGLSKLLNTVTLVKQRINPELVVSGVALCMHEPYTRLASEVVEDLKGFLTAARETPVAWSQAKLFDTFIRRNIRLAEASSFGQTVFDYAPKSNGAADYAQLAIEIFGEAARFEKVEVEAGGNGAVHPEPAPRDSQEPVVAERAATETAPAMGPGQPEPRDEPDRQAVVSPGPALTRLASVGLPGSQHAGAGSWPQSP